VVPSGVTLAGRGLATVLHAAKPDQTTSLIVARRADKVSIRDLVILGEYERRAFRSPAIILEEVQQAEVFAVDVRGWEGTALQVTGGGVQVRDCRALGCAGNGFEFSSTQVICVGNIAHQCSNGFGFGLTGAGSRAEANIAGGNRGNGYQAERGNGILFTANNASFNDLDGFRLTDTEGADLIANMAANNNQSGAAGVGLHLAGATRGCHLYYNNCQDEQMQTTQVQGILEEPTAGGNFIRFNLTRKPTGIVAQGEGSTVSDNADM